MIWPGGALLVKTALTALPDFKFSYNSSETVNSNVSNKTCDSLALELSFSGSAYPKLALRWGLFLLLFVNSRNWQTAGKNYSM